MQEEEKKKTWSPFVSRSPLTSGPGAREKNISDCQQSLLADCRPGVGIVRVILTLVVGGSNPWVELTALGTKKEKKRASNLMRVRGGRGVGGGGNSKKKRT